MIQFVKKIFYRNWLPAYVLNKKPLLLAAYDTDFLRARSSFAAAIPSGTKVNLLIQLGWQHETDSAAEQFSTELKAAMADMPDWNILILANSPQEEQQLRTRGIQVRFCHQNAFLDEKRYPLQKNPRKETDAIYIARISPFKRHSLAAKVESLRLIGTYSEREKAYAQQILRDLNHAAWTEKVRSTQIYKDIEKANCGLCLSAEEGAMFVAAEYLLCGIPIVNTPNIGGRDQVFPDFAVQTVQPTPEAVAEGVRYWKNHPQEPLKIRNAFLENLQPHRKKLQEIIREMIGDIQVPLPHKLGIRTTLLPWDRMMHGIRKPAAGENSEK